MAGVKLLISGTPEAGLVRILLTLVFNPVFLGLNIPDTIIDVISRLNVLLLA
jgi:hypothetical protein